MCSFPGLFHVSLLNLMCYAGSPWYDIMLRTCRRFIYLTFSDVHNRNAVSLCFLKKKPSNIWRWPDLNCTKCTTHLKRTRDNWLLTSSIYSPARQQYGSSVCWLRKHCLAVLTCVRMLAPHSRLWSLPPLPGQVQFSVLAPAMPIGSPSIYMCNKNTVCWGKQGKPASGWEC